MMDLSEEILSELRKSLEGSQESREQLLSIVVQTLMSQSKDFGEQSYRYFYSNYDKLVEQGEAFEAQSDDTKLDEIVAPMETIRESVLSRLVDVLAKDPYHADQLVE